MNAHIARLVAFSGACAMLSGCYVHHSCVYVEDVSLPKGLEIDSSARVADVELSVAGDGRRETWMKRTFDQKRQTVISTCNNLDPLKSGGDDSVKVKVKFMEEESDWHGFNFLLYMCTFGVIPTHVDTSFSGEVQIDNADDGTEVGRVPLKLNHSWTVSCFSPFALFQTYPRDPSAVCDESTKTALSSKTEGKYKMEELAIEVLREGIGAAVAKWRQAVPVRKPGETPALAPEKSGRQKDLDDLYRSGIISEEEYRREAEKLKAI